MSWEILGGGRPHWVEEKGARAGLVTRVSGPAPVEAAVARRGWGEGRPWGQTVGSHLKAKMEVILDKNLRLRLSMW